MASALATSCAFAATQPKIRDLVLEFKPVVAHAIAAE
jgi:hypothetical protein